MDQPGLSAVETFLLDRWPEQRLEPSLEVIRALAQHLSHPERDFRAVHVTGTNGKTTTSRLIDALLRAHHYSTGRFTSPHLNRVTERISLAGQPVSDNEFCRSFQAVRPAAEAVDAISDRRATFFELTVAMAVECFSRAKVEVAVVEVGMGGSWDATNVVDAEVAVLLPVALDHMTYLGSTVEAIAYEKAGIIKPGATVVCAGQVDAAAQVIAERIRSVGARLLREGYDFGVTERSTANGQQIITVQGLHGSYRNLHLNVPGQHNAQNCAVAIAATESIMKRPLDPRTLAVALEAFVSPGRYEVLPGTIPLILDAAHNPHGAQALAAALRDDGRIDGVGIVSVLDDKDVTGVIAALRPVLKQIICFENRSPRATAIEKLARIVEGIFPDNVSVAADAEAALAEASRVVDAYRSQDCDVAASYVVGFGSVVTVGELRAAVAGGAWPA